MLTQVKRPLPPKFRALIDYNWQFPIDFPVVNNTTSPDATRTLKEVIKRALQEHYFDYRIHTHDVTKFTREFQSVLYEKMSQHQYLIDQYLNLITDNQFF